MEPKIRLKGFSGKWISHSLKEKEFTIVAGGDIDKQSIRQHGRYPVIANALSNDGIVGYYDRYYRIEAPSVSVTGRGEIGYAQARKTSFTPVVRLLSIQSHHDVDFLANAINCKKVVQESTGVPQLTTDKLSQYEIAFPEKIEEEKAIGNYISSIDSLIQSSTKKIESLKQVKAASLQSMFPQEGETKPRVRFKGFSGEWDVVSLGDCLTINSEKNQNNIYDINDVLSVSDEVGVANQIKFLGRSYAGKSVSNYRILKTNQIVYTKSPLKSKPYGIVKVNKGSVGIVSVLYAVYDAKENVHPDFIHYYFDPSYRINNYLLPLINKGAKNTMNISDEMALTGKICIPSYNEQWQIAQYLQSLDTQITLQTQRLEKLKQIKSACLDNMFV